MWTWLKSLFSRSKSDGQDTVVPDEEYDFRFGTKSSVPEGLKRLKVTELSRQALLFENYDVDFTIAENGFSRDLSSIVWASQSLRWSKSYHDLTTEPKAPVRLHRMNLLQWKTYSMDATELAGDLQLWFSHLQWNADRPFRVQQATSKSPLEDGFFSCLRVVTGGLPDDPIPEMSWMLVERNSSLEDTLAAFVEAELQRVAYNCEGFLDSLYGEMPEDKLTHPVFALVDWPVVDMGIIRTTFAGSIWSESELRFWSRPTYYHK